MSLLYAFLGHQAELSILELETLTGVKPEVVSPEIVSLPDDTNLLAIADKLGGTAKIAQTIDVVPHGDVLGRLEELMTAGENKNVALSNYTPRHIEAGDIRDLKARIAVKKPIRFVSFEDHGHELLMISKQHVAEYNLIPRGDEIIIAETAWIYDSLGFAARDRKKPYQDIKRGMLPVKVARIMVNLALKGQEGKTVLDPFCGTGTVLSEAVMVGSKVVGSDLDHLAISGAETNLSWLSSRYNIPHTAYNLFVSDATHVDEHIQSVDVVVTEPLMGPLLDVRIEIPEDKVKNVAKGLDKLYRGSLKAWHKMLPDGGRVVITIPTFRLGGHDIPTISIDTIMSLGYNYVLSVPYSKPGATVIRNITILEKN